MNAIKEDLLETLQKFSPLWVDENYLKSRLSDLAEPQVEVLTRILKSELSGVESFSLRDSLYDDFYCIDQNLNSLISEILSSKLPIQSILQNTNTGLFSRELQNEALEVEALKKSGYQISKHSLDATRIDEIMNCIKPLIFSNRGIFESEVSGEDLQRRIKDGTISKLLGANGDTFWIKDINDLVSIECFQKIAFDPYILRIVSGYLGCCPIHVQTNLWFSFPTFSEKNNLSTNGQLFHQDKEFIKFIKVFVYLSNVGLENGPHVYVEGSHIDEAHLKGIKFSERIHDSEIDHLYDPKRIKVLIGGAGDITFGDTSCIHKGMPVIEGHRIMLQFEYASSLYLSPVKPFKNIENFSIPGFGLTSPIIKRLTKNYSSQMRYIFEKIERSKDFHKPHFLIKLLRLLKRYIVKEDIV